MNKHPWLPGSISLRDPATLKPSPHNARRHSAAQIEKLAQSIAKYGFPMPMLISADNVVIAGHGRLEAAKKIQLEKVPCVVADHLSEADRRAYTIADNHLASLSEWDDAALAKEIAALANQSADLTAIGYSDKELQKIISNMTNAGADADTVPPISDEPPKSQAGIIYQLGPHRLLCGDSTNADTVTQLIGADTKADLLHADPPYGMGKENDGVENDNLYNEKLDSFQVQWWHAWRPHLAANASVYIWGTAEDLWRLWHAKLSRTEPMTMRNEITWHKKIAQGQLSDNHRMFPTATERCLFFALGQQGFNNNSDNYWEGWEPIRKYLAGEVKKMAWNNKTVAAFFNFHPRMADHWFSKSQWTMPTAEQYKKLQEHAAGDAFKKDYDAFKKDYDELKKDYDELKKEFYKTRFYFDNTHEAMTDVWEFSRVTGDERHNHATPKPVDMIARAIKSSCPPGGLVLEPFAGTGSTLIAAAATRRICYTAEISPAYCDVIRRRWTNYAKQNNLAIGTGGLE